jgi:hypothetical protein
MATQPMSDIPGAAFWTLSVLFASRMSAPRDAVLAGAAAGIAILIRPNLAPLAAIPGLLVLTTSDGVKRILVRGTLFSVGCAPFLVTAGALFNHMYGAPLRSGYGSLDQYYSWSNMVPNLAKYSRWFSEAHGVPAFAFVLAPLIAFRYRGTARTQRLLFFFFIAVLFVSYLFFLSFQEWWYLRFLLAAFPFAFILGADAVSTLAVRFGRVARIATLLAFSVVAILVPAFDSLSRHVLETAPDRRYVDAARYVDTELPRDSIVITMQHSGSLAYYSNKLPLRYDRIAPEWIDRTIDYFHDRGRKVYLLLDDWEIPEFLERFKGREAAALVSADPMAATSDGRVRLFAVDESERGGPTSRMRKTHGCVPPAQPNLYSRRHE